MVANMIVTNLVAAAEDVEFMRNDLVRLVVMANLKLLVWLVKDKLGGLVRNVRFYILIFSLKSVLVPLFRCGRAALLVVVLVHGAIPVSIGMVVGVENSVAVVCLACHQSNTI